MMRARLVVILLLAVPSLQAATVFEPGTSPVPFPVPFLPGVLAVETAAGMVPPRPGCPQGSLVLFAGNRNSVLTRPLLDPAAGTLELRPQTGTTVIPEGWDGQLQRLVNGDLLALFHATSKEPLPAAQQPSWWNQWFTSPPPDGKPNPRNGYRQVEILWRTSCGTDAASWETPTAAFDSALAVAIDAQGKPQKGYCGKMGPWVQGLDRPQLAIDPWGVDPNDPRRQRIFLASKCDRDDDTSVQIWVSNDTGLTWPTAAWRLPRAGVTAMSTVASGRLYVLQCEGAAARLYWSDDHGLSKAGALDITLPGLPCAQLSSNDAGVSQPAITEVSLARLGPDTVVAAYPSVEDVPNEKLPRKRQLYPVVRIDPGPGGTPKSQPLSVFRAFAKTGSVLQAQLVEDNRQVSADRTAVIFWLETNDVELPGFPGRQLRTRGAMIRDLGTKQAVSPVITIDLSSGSWFWARTDQQGLGDYTKGGFALDAYGIPHFVLSWPQDQDNHVMVLTPSPAPSSSRFNAVWRRGAGPSEFGFRLSMDELKARDQDLQTRGYRLADLNALSLPEGILYNAIWRKTTVAGSWVAGWTLPDLQKHSNQLDKQGLQVSAVEGFMTPGGLRYNAVWTAAPGARRWNAGWTFADFSARNAELAKQGFQLDRLHSFLMPEGLRYDAVWVQSQKERPWIAGWTFEDLHKKNGELRGKFDLVDLQAVVLPEGPRYDAVWETRIGLVEAPAITCWNHLDAAKKVAELGRKGWTLTRLYGFVLP